MELEHEMHIAKDLQREVDYYDSMLQLEEKYDKLQRQILKLSNVEGSRLILQLLVKCIINA